ncbi:MAG: BrnA antitoxin family protein [Cyanobacteria bacterium J06649_4]
MREEYDFSQSTPNPYAEKLKRQVSIRVEEEVVDYFQALAEETNIPYQALINLYLKDCVTSRRKLSLEWATTSDS